MLIGTDIKLPMLNLLGVIVQKLLIVFSCLFYVCQIALGVIWIECNLLIQILYDFFKEINWENLKLELIKKLWFFRCYGDLFEQLLVLVFHDLEFET